MPLISISTSTWKHDRKAAWRFLVRQPLFTLATALTLALGIGANTAIFSVAYGVLLRPLGLSEPDGLAIVRLHRINNEGDGSGFYQTYFSDLQQSLDTDEAIRGFTSFMYESITLADGEDVFELNNTLAVDGDFFELMGATPLLGRLLAHEDVIADRRGNVCVIGENLWKNRFGGDPGILGQTLLLDNAATTVVGVVPADLPLPSAETNIWIPQGWDLEDRALLGRLVVFARLRDADSFPEAQAWLTSAASKLGDDYPRFEDYTMALQGFEEGLVGSARPAIALASIAAGLILLLACANVANMLLSRSATRRAEIGTRRAVGATRRQLTSQLLSESLALAGLAGVLGVLLATQLHKALLALAPSYLPRVEAVRLDLPVLLFALGTSVLTGLVFGLAPLGHLIRADGFQAAMSGGRLTSRRSWASHSLVVTQVALSVILLVGAGLMVRSLLLLRAVDMGFQHDQVAAARVYLDDAAYRTDEQELRYFSELTERLSSLPEIAAAGAGSALPMDPITIDYDLPYVIPGRVDATDEVRQAFFRTITPGFLETMQIPLKAGRVFDSRDRVDTEKVAIINESFAALEWAERDPVGQSFQIYGGRLELRIVGIVGDVHFANPGAAYKPEFFVPHTQTTYGAMTVVARSADPEMASRLIATEALKLDNRQPVSSHFTLSSLLAASLSSDRFLTSLLVSFALLALLISAAGIFAVLSYWVNQSRREIGVRVAFGASTASISAMVLRKGLTLALIGLAIGLVGSQLASRLMHEFLFEVTTTDSTALFAGIALLLLTATSATLVPAWRATRLDPVRSLRLD